MINVHGSGLPHSNVNLLDNPWFQINQRGQSSYSGQGYTVDRWHLYNGILSIESDGVKISVKSEPGYASFVEYIEVNLLGKVLTLSVKYGGQIYFVRGMMTDHPDTTEIRVVLPFGFARAYSHNQYALVELIIDSQMTAAISAVKLEFGPISTLAYDSPPNYQQELAKCQRYFYISGTGPTGCQIKTSLHGNDHILGRVDFPVAMRIAPTVKIISMGGTENTVSEWGSGADELSGKCFVNTASLNQNGFNGIRVEGGGADANANYAWQVIADANIY